jgi:V8-like Glu-specific endopeptidase
LRRRLVLVPAFVVAVGVYAIISTPPKPSIREETLGHWTAQRLTAWVALRAPGSSSATASPPGSGVNIGKPWGQDGLVARSSGRIFFAVAGDDSACSGTVLTDQRSDVSLVITAAHCVYDLQSDTFATDWLFVPGLAQGEIPDCQTRSLGCWTPNALLVEQAFVSAGTYNQIALRHDIGIAVIGPGPAKDQLDQAVGSLALADGSISDGEFVDLVGYPGDRQYSGSALTFCSGPMSQAGASIWAMECDMTGGASGGAWIARASTAAPVIASVTSGGTGGIRAGPVFDADTAALILAAESATANTVLAR